MYAELQQGLRLPAHAHRGQQLVRIAQRAHAGGCPDGVGVRQGRERRGAVEGGGRGGRGGEGVEGAGLHG